MPSDSSTGSVFGTSSADSVALWAYGLNVWTCRFTLLWRTWWMLVEIWCPAPVLHKCVSRMIHLDDSLPVDVCIWESNAHNDLEPYDIGNLEWINECFSGHRALHGVRWSRTGPAWMTLSHFLSCIMKRVDKDANPSGYAKGVVNVEL